MKNIKLRNKLILIIISVCAISLLIGFAFSIFSRINHIKETEYESLVFIANTIATTSIDALNKNNPKGIETIIKNFESTSDILACVILNRKLSPFAVYKKKDYSLIIDDVKTTEYFTITGNQARFYYPLIVNEELNGVIFLEKRSLMYSNINQKILLYILVFTVILIFASIVAYFSQKIISSPIIKLTKSAQKLILSNDYSINMEHDSQDEIGELVRSFNALIEYLKSKEIKSDLADVETKLLNRELEKIIKERTADLNKAYTDLENFAYVTSHDLKTPIRGISQPAQWLLQDHSQNLDDDGIELIKIMLNRVSRMDRLIDGIQLYLKIRNPNKKQESINLNVILDKLITEVRKKSKIKITVKNELPEIIADKFRLEILFKNLIENSVQFMDKNNGEVNISCSEDDNNWYFSVKDNGPGIDKKFHLKVFDLFQTLDTMENSENIGIGLSIVKKIVEIYDGYISIESDLGRGCEVKFSLYKHNH